MNRALFSEYRSMYSSAREHPTVIRIRIRMRDLVDPDCMRDAVDTTMKRYPYFCVELKVGENNLWEYADNDRPVVITHSLSGVELNSEASNYHLISFSYQDNWIIMDVSHALTDGTGAYEVVRTFLYYYCSQRYHAAISPDGVRLAGDVIAQEEWDDPMEKATDLPTPPRPELPAAINPVIDAHQKGDFERTVYSVAIDEKEFMRFNIQNDGSPATMIALLFSRAMARLYPDRKDVIRVALALNQRGGLGTPKAHQSLVGGVFLEYKDAIRVALALNQRGGLGTPLAHQSLVGGVFLEYKDAIKDWTIERQATAYRGMVFVQTMKKNVLAGVASMKGVNQMLMSKTSDQERLAIVDAMGEVTDRLITATVSYIGKAGFKESEDYIRDFRLWTSAAGNTLLIEVSAVGGRFTIDFLQSFSSPLYVNAFLAELEDNGVKYDLQDVMKTELPNIRYPWAE